MKELVPNRLWIREMPLRLFGLEWGTRMSVVRLSGEGGALWLHSPVVLDQRLREDLEGLGQVRFVVCPNVGHHMFAAGYFAAYPDAGFYAAPGLPEKRTDLPFDGVLGDEPESGWDRDLEQAVFRGNRMVREVAFCHQESRTLIVADLVQSADSGSPLLTRLVKRLMGTNKRPGLPLPFRLGFRDKVAARAGTWLTRPLQASVPVLLDLDHESTRRWCLYPQTNWIEWHDLNDPLLNFGAILARVGKICASAEYECIGRPNPLVNGLGLALAIYGAPNFPFWFRFQDTNTITSRIA